MCGRYRIEAEPNSDALNAVIEAVNRRAADAPVRIRGDIRPADAAPVVASSRRMSPAVFAMQWGYTLGDGRRVINARSETAASKPLFKDGMQNRRCAVPATNYYEWARGDDRGTRYIICPAEEGPFYMAGIYRLEQSRPVFAILTREPATSIAFIHDRMPVILPPELVKDWIDPRSDAAEILKQAVLDVSHAREPGDEQMKMEF